MLRAGRRRLRGATLAEAALALTAIALAGFFAVETSRAHLQRAALQAEARSLSEFADMTARGAARGLSDRLVRLRLTPGRTERLTAADLRAAGWLEPGRDLTTARRRAVAIGVWRPTAALGEERLVAAAWTPPNPAGGSGAPRGGAGIGLTGRVGGAGRACPARWICGDGLRWNAAAMIAGFGAGGPEAGSMISLRLLHMAADADPALHRLPQPGAPHLNTVEGDFDMRGAAIAGFASLAAGELLTDGRLELSGTGAFGGGHVAADVISGAGGASAGRLAGEAARLFAAGDVNGRVLNVTAAAAAGGFRAGSAELEGLFVTGELESSGRAELTSIGWSVGAAAAAAGSLAAPAVSAAALTVRGALTVTAADVSGTLDGGRIELGGLSGFTGTGWISELNTPFCSGC